MIPHSSSSVSREDFHWVDSLIEGNFVGDGRLCTRFRDDLMRFAGQRVAILTNSGAAALELALRALRERYPGRKRVLVCAYSCPAVVSAIIRQQLEPVLIDVCPASMNIDMLKAKHVVDEWTLTCIATHMGGFPDNLDQAGDLACPLISDSAQAFGATWKGRHVTGFGVFSLVSFGPTKMITAGMGGALFCGADDWIEIAQRLGQDEWQPDDYVSKGFTATHGQKYSELNAALGIAQLARIDDFVRKRKTIADQYTRILQQDDAIALPDVPHPAIPSYYRYYFFSEHAAAWIRFLRAGGVDVRSSFSHNMPAYFGWQQDCPVLASRTTQLVSLPIHPALSSCEVSAILALLTKGIEKGIG